MKKFKQWIESIDWDSINYDYESTDFSHKLNFFNNSGAIGYIEWDKDTGEVDKIFVGDKIRRQGIGTFIWETATDWAIENNEMPPEHSSRRTESGDFFAKSVGGYIPELTDDIDGWTS